MSVIVRLQNLPWTANAVDIRQYFHGLSIPEGGVHIVGGEMGDAFIAFSTDEDARQAMLRDGGKVKDTQIKLYLSSRTEMQKIIDQARQQSLGMQQFISMPAVQMPPMPVPVPNMSVPSMPVPSVSIPNVTSMQVPLQNVAAMVTNMGKPDPSAINRTSAGIGGAPQNIDNKPVSSNQSVKSDNTDKDKKDKRHRRTRSHSKDSSNSRSDSRSRSRSRSSSRSRDRRGRGHYDRRRKRSRSRDRRSRRRERSRSRERSYRDRRNYYNRSRDDFEENNQPSRWNNPAQRNRDDQQRIRQNKMRQELYNNDSQNQNRGQLQQKPNLPKGESNTEPTTDPVRRPFPNENSNQGDHAKDPKSRFSPIAQSKDNNSGADPSVSTQPTSAAPSIPKAPLNSQGFNALPPPPMFNPQAIVRYPEYTPSSMSSFTTFSPSHQLNTPKPQDASKIQESKKPPDFRRAESRNSPVNNSSGLESMPNLNSTTIDLTEEKNKSRFENETPSNIPMPTDTARGSIGWGFKDTKYPYPNKEANPGSNLPDQFNSPWGSKNSNTNNKNAPKTFSKMLANTCVQVKSVPDYTTHDDIRGFFRINKIESGCLKIVKDDQGRISGVYVKFNSVGDKKKAICKSGCLLNNSIVTVTHVDDDEFNSAGDFMNSSSWPAWHMGNEEMDKNNMAQDELNPEFHSVFDSIKIQGSMRYHPFYNAKNKIYTHIKTLVNKYNPIDVCIVKMRGQTNIDAFMKFDSHVVAEAVINFLNTVTVEGKLINVAPCSSEEYEEAKECSVAMDVQHFLKSARSQPGNFGKQEDRADPRLHSTSYKDRRPKPDDFIEDDSYDDDMEMQDVQDEPEVEFKRTNKVLLPTPGPLMAPLPHNIPKDNMYGGVPLITNCIIIQNLPLQANDRDIIDFFSDVGLVPTQIHIMLDPNGKQYGDAFCEFDKNEEAISASNKDNCMIGPNNIRVRLVSMQEMTNALGISVLTPAPPSQTAPPFFNGPTGMFGNNARMGMQDPRMGNDWGPPSFNSTGGPMGSNQMNFNPPNGPGFRPGPLGRDGEFGGRGGEFGGRGGDFGGRGGEFGGRGGRGRGDMMGGRGGRGSDGGRGMDRGRGGRGSMRGSDISRGGRGGGGGEMNRGGRGGGGGGGEMSRGGRGGGGGGGEMSRGGRGGGGGGGEMSRGGRGGGEQRGRGGRGMSRGGSMPRGGRRDMNEYPPGRNPPPDLMSLPSGPLKDGPSGSPQVSGSITCPIQLEEESVREFGQQGCVVSAENIPYRADLNDILDFFGGFDITAESIIRRYNDAGQVTGDARIAFKTPQDAQNAIKYLNKKQIGGRSVFLNLFK